MKRLPALGLIFAGGTYYLDQRGRWLAVRSERDIGPWLAGLPELKLIATVKPAFVLGEGAGPVTSVQWQRLAETIAEQYRQVDGVIVLHGVESFVYTAAALSLALTHLNKPIVLTGSPSARAKPRRPARSAIKLGAYRDVGVRANLLNAAHLALGDLAEVVVTYGNGIFRASQLERSSDQANVFASASDKTLGRVDFGVNLKAPVSPRHQRRVLVRPRFDPKVHVLDYHPGVSDGWLEQHRRTLAGLVVTLDDLRALTPAFRKQLLQARRENIAPVLYLPTARVSQERQLIIVNDMTLEMTLVKLMWALGQTREYGRIAKLMHQNIAGEKIKRLRQ